MMETIAGGLHGLKTAMETISGLNTAVTEARIAEAKTQIVASLIQAQAGLLDAQRTLLEDTDTIRALEAEIVHLKDWSAEAECYELADAGQGCLAYRLKDANRSGQPPHWLCPDCFAKTKKAILQPVRLPMRGEALRCHPCGLQLTVLGQPDTGRGR